MVATRAYVDAVSSLVCPDCPVGRDARMLFFHGDLIRNLLIAVSPFVVTLGLVLLIVRAVSPRRDPGSSRCD